jgi:outer membrane protein assembly factor BamB
MLKRFTRTAVLALALSGAFAARADWPEFRGPFANGHVLPPGSTNRAGLPLGWSEAQNVKWKTPIPHRGWSTPVILGDQIWLTTATEEGHDFFAVCLDAETGRVRFNERVFHCDAPEPLGNRLNSYASPSPVIEPGRVYVHFGSYGTACLDTRTFKTLWKRTDLPCRHYRGPGSSPILFERLLVLTMDGVDVQYLVALDSKTGRTVWKSDRTAEWNDLDSDGRPIGEGDYRKAYSTPIVAQANGRTQMFNIGAKAVYSHDPRTGREWWKVRHPAFSGASRPLYAEGLVFMPTGHGRGEVLAIRTDGNGDVTDTHVVWRTARGVPRMPSPVLVDGLLFMVSDSGTATCLEAATGRELWQERLPGEYAASLLYADGRIYAFNQTGVCTVFRAARRFEVLATNRLDAGFMAPPAVHGRALILRTKTHLYRIEESPAH